tara:strand:- start:2592 stop:2855 length:264 start_codon:yes stop_codon:yes gene_type:complete
MPLGRNQMQRYRWQLLFQRFYRATLPSALHEKSSLPSRYRFDPVVFLAFYESLQAYLFYKNDCSVLDHEGDRAYVPSNSGLDAIPEF